MEKFIVIGFSHKLGKRQFHLTIPKSKHYKVLAVRDGEQELLEELFVEKAVTIDESEALHHSQPFVKIGEDLPRTLQKILLKHPYPLSQGPVMLPVDCLTSEHFERSPIPKSFSEVLTTKTVFSHGESQGCFEWLPMINGVTAWGQKTPSYDTKNLTFSVSAVASTRDMSVVYTCNFTKCVIHCPCTICRDRRVNCKFLCKTEVCCGCNSQCTQHEIKVARLFQFGTDHYTLKTEMMAKYRLGTAYAGIPLSCESCTRDVLEHQVLHLTWHVRCRFCRFEMRPFEHKSVVSRIDFQTAEKVIKDRDARTCSVCLLQSKSPYSRKKHEQRIHFGEDRKYTCDKCGKTYSNRNALNYHEETHADNKCECDLCGFKTSTKINLLKHKQVQHENGHAEQFKCEECDKSFSVKKSLYRHNREKHFESKANFDYVEEMDSFKVSCEHCDHQFKRKSDLMRHHARAHEENTRRKDFKCLECDKTFSRKADVNRHTKNLHKK